MQFVTPEPKPKKCPSLRNIKRDVINGALAGLVTGVLGWLFSGEAVWLFAVIPGALLGFTVVLGLVALVNLKPPVLW